MELLSVSEQSWVMAEVWGTGGRKCCHFWESKVGDSANYHLGFDISPSGYNC